MSRNKEKAQAGLNRYYEQKIQDAGVITADPSNRPRKVQTVKTLAEAELWRRSVVSEFLVKLAQINDPSLSEDELRDLNEELNRKTNEKRAWEHHILSLGGNDYMKYDKSVGVRVGGKFYFGRAKELSEAKVPAKVKFVPGEKASSSISSDSSKHSLAYYGVYDQNEIASKIDASREKIMTEINGALGEQVFPDVPVGEKPDSTAYTQRDVERWFVERKKRELLAKLML